MKMKADDSSCFDRAGAACGVLPLLVTGVAIILFSTAGVARMMGWGSNSTEDSGGTPTLDQTATEPTTGKAGAKPGCSECGVIVSMREIERHDEATGPGAAKGATAGNGDEMRVKATRGYEIAIRMADGSSRVIDAAFPTRWRMGERLILIAGSTPPLQ